MPERRNDAARPGAGQGWWKRLEPQAVVTLALLAVAAVLFISGKVRADLVAVGLMLLLMLTGILTPKEALSGFANPVVIMMVGLFVVGGGIFRTGLAQIAGSRLLRLAGTSETRLLITVMLVTALFGAFVSNTGTVAVMLPVVVGMASAAGVDAGRLLMPLAFASTMGGMLTLIGTPPNLIINETLLAAGYDGLTLFSITPVGVICLATGILGMLVMRRFLPEGEPGEHGPNASPGLAHPVQAIFRKYRLADHLYRIYVPARSPICGMTVADLALPDRFGLNILEIRRRLTVRDRLFKTVTQEIAGPETRIEAGDTLFVYGPWETVRRFVDHDRLRLLDRHEEAPVAPRERYELTDEIGFAEAMLTPHSRYIGRTVKEAGIREHFRLNVLGIQRRDAFLLHNVQDEPLRFGDALLVQGAWCDLALFAGNHDDVVVAGPPPLEQAWSVTLDRKAPIAAGILLLMLGLLVTGWVPAVAAILLAAVLMVVFGCVRGMDAAYKTVNWNTVVLIGAMFPTSVAVEKTGVAALLSSWLVAGLGGYAPVALLAGVYAATSLLTLFISNTAAAVLLAPIALDAAVAIHASPLPFLVAVAVAASMCFASPFSTPPNAMVMSAGRYTTRHYVQVGLPLQLGMGAMMIAVLPWLFPF